MTNEPAEFPNCKTCSYALQHRADICLPCIRRNTPQPAAVSCPICTQNLYPNGKCPNALCRRNDRELDSLRVLAMYDGRVVQKIHRLKGIRGHAPGRGWGAGPFGAGLAGLIGEMFPPPAAPLIVANPGNPSKDYDAVRELMVGIRAAATFPNAQHLNIEPDATVARVHDVESLRDKGIARRGAVARGSMREALRVTHPDRVRGHQVVLVDDLFVTGNTLNEVARALKKAGATRVDAVAIARKVWWPTRSR